MVNPLTALLGLANTLLYTLIYTPLKPRTSLSTLIGAVLRRGAAGHGLDGATNQLAPQSLLLAAILFVWQIPHFLSLVWLYRSDYTIAGYRMLPVIDSSGRLTCLLIVLILVALLPLGLMLTFCGVAGYFFGAASLVLGLGLFLLALQLWATRTRQNARRVFLASIAYLPLLLAFLLADSYACTHRWEPAARFSGNDSWNRRGPRGRRGKTLRGRSPRRSDADLGLRALGSCEWVPAPERRPALPES